MHKECSWQPGDQPAERLLLWGHKLLLFCWRSSASQGCTQKLIWTNSHHSYAHLTFVMMVGVLFFFFFFPPCRDLISSENRIITSEKPRTDVSCCYRCFYICMYEIRYLYVISITSFMAQHYCPEQWWNQQLSQTSSAGWQTANQPTGLKSWTVVKV